jgi:CDP-paratose 2-epimerase
MGKVDQGFIVLWMARHLFGGALSYMGFGGDGLQVRDVLHVDDLYELLVKQFAGLDRNSETALCNVGGGMDNSVSLCELTALCQEITGKRIEIGRVAESRDADIPYYVSDCSAVTGATGWKPRRNLRTVLEDVQRWLVDNRHQVQAVLS